MWNPTAATVPSADRATARPPFEEPELIERMLLATVSAGFLSKKQLRGREVEPEAHMVHACALVALGTCWDKFPCEHGKQADRPRPDRLLKLPEGHGVHPVPSAKLPALQPAFHRRTKIPEPPAPDKEL